FLLGLLHLLLHLLDLLHHLVDVLPSSQTGVSSPNAQLIFKLPSAKASTVRLSITYTLRRSSGENTSEAQGGEGCKGLEDEPPVPLHRL
ncbi:MAG: hypothetical protein M3441_23645, partial [Chloroflexota bacterium]|nr:hypothetical protein [Chloroflexota bacterium]